MDTTITNATEYRNLPLAMVPQVRFTSHICRVIPSFT